MTDKERSIRKIISSKNRPHLDFSLKSKTEKFTDNLFYTLFVNLMNTSMQLDHTIINNTKMMPIALGKAVLDMLSTLTPFNILPFLR